MEPQIIWVKTAMMDEGRACRLNRLPPPVDGPGGESILRSIRGSFERTLSLLFRGALRRREARETTAQNRNRDVKPNRLIRNMPKGGARANATLFERRK